MQISRRQLLKTASLATAGLALPLGVGIRRAHAFTQSPAIPKFLDPLRRVGAPIPVAAPDGRLPGGLETFSTTFPSPAAWTAQHYTIDIGQFQDRLCSTILGPTTLWGYHPANVLLGSATQKHLGGIILAEKGTPTQVTFRNRLPATHILPVDASIPMDPSPGGNAPNRTAVHVHGGLTPWLTDGGPFDWFDPAGNHGLSFLNNTVLNPNAASNEAEYYYPNNQSARFVWYHDHAIGLTRLNAYAGIASGYVITDDYETALSLPPVNLPGPLDARTHYILVQDKIFVDRNTINTTDLTWVQQGLPASTGSLWYAHVYDPARWELGPAPAGPPPDPSVVAEFFGDTMLVNGAVYPFVEVEQRQYRFRLLNACNARFLNLQIVKAQSNRLSDISSREGSNALGPAFVQIATEGGFLPAPAMLAGRSQPRLLLGPAERADVIVDFRSVSPGTVLILHNNAPAPYPTGDLRNDYNYANNKTPFAQKGFGPDSRNLLQIRVKARTGPADPPIALPAAFTPTDPFLVTQTPGVPIVPPVAGGFAPIRLSPAYGGQIVSARYRYLTLNEGFDEHGRLIQHLGTNVVTNLGAPGGFGRLYDSDPTETPAEGDVEIWEVINLTGDTHPIHFHLVNVQILSRQPITASRYTGGAVPYRAAATAPDANELGWKDTIRMNPGEVTRVIMKFDLSAVPFAVPRSPRTGDNEYVWHCHILEHEEHDMMRPLVVTGVNPTFAVSPPQEVVGATGGTASYQISGGIAPYTVSQVAPASPVFALTVGSQGFDVTVGAGTAAGDAVFEIRDSGLPQSSGIAVLHIR